MTTTQAFRNALHVPANDPASIGRSIVVTTPGDEYIADWLLAGGTPEAPLDGKQYGRQSESWTVVDPKMTPAEILTALKTVDGTGSGLDADFLDGLNSGAFALKSDLDVVDAGEY
jgi:hypothetical protein